MQTNETRNPASMFPVETVRGVSYWQTRSGALQYAGYHGLPIGRIIAYGRGHAIQRNISGPYWNAIALEWQ